MTTNFLEFEIFNGNLENLISEVHISLHQNAYHFCSADAIVQADMAPSLGEIFKVGKLICDSRYLQIYLSLRKPKVKQIRGADFLRGVILSKKMIPEEHFFIVANNELKSELLKFIFEQAHTNLSPTNIYVPGFLEHWYGENEAIEKVLQDNRIKYVWVGIGSPKQFYLSEYISTKFHLKTFSVGAAFDFVLGTKKEANMITRKIGAEWLVRLLSEPKRLWRRYLFGNIHFLRLIIRDVLK
jgi:N-acetylglucosaminyldiphosphoundecaprenol N-acetyl-beta-D-mannosaminyltransferase